VDAADVDDAPEWELLEHAASISAAHTTSAPAPVVWRDA
jgi:hypothetical protein